MASGTITLHCSDNKITLKTYNRSQICCVSHFRAMQPSLRSGLHQTHPTMSQLEPCRHASCALLSRCHCLTSTLLHWAQSIMCGCSSMNHGYRSGCYDNFTHDDTIATLCSCHTLYCSTTASGHCTSHYRTSGNLPCPKGFTSTWHLPVTRSLQHNQEQTPIRYIVCASQDTISTNLTEA